MARISFVWQHRSLQAGLSELTGFICIWDPFSLFLKVRWQSLAGPFTKRIPGHGTDDVLENRFQNLRWKIILSLNIPRSKQSEYLIIVNTARSRVTRYALFCIKCYQLHACSVQDASEMNTIAVTNWAFLQKKCCFLYSWTPHNVMFWKEIQKRLRVWSSELRKVPCV